MKLSAPLLGSTLLFPLSLPLYGEQEVVWGQGFENDLGKAAPYHASEPAQPIERIEGDAAEGGFYLRTPLPGLRPLEGIYLTAFKIPGNRMVKVSARLRGSGRIGMMLRSGNGWLYPKAPIDLNHDWQEVTLSKTLVNAETDDLVIYFLTQPTQAVLKEAVIEVDDLKVAAFPALELADLEVPPKYLPASEFALEHFTQDQSRGGIEGEKRLDLHDIPFPQTARAVSLSICVKADRPSRLQLQTNRGGLPQSIRESELPGGGSWHWHTFKNLSAEEVGEGFMVSLSTSKGGIGLKGIVITTEESLNDQALESLIP